MITLAQDRIREMMGQMVTDQFKLMVDTVLSKSLSLLEDAVQPLDLAPDDQKPEDQEPERIRQEDPKPVNLMPEDQIPVNLMPEDQIPVNLMPEDQKPVNPLPEDHKPEDQIPEDQNPVNPKPEDKEPVNPVAIVTAPPEASLDVTSLQDPIDRGKLHDPELVCLNGSQDLEVAEVSEKEQSNGDHTHDLTEPEERSGTRAGDNNAGPELNVDAKSAGGAPSGDLLKSERDVIATILQNGDGQQTRRFQQNGVNGHARRLPKAPVTSPIPSNLTSNLFRKNVSPAAAARAKFLNSNFISGQK
jgi:hypothetical protein